MTSLFQLTSIRSNKIGSDMDKHLILQIADHLDGLASGAIIPEFRGCGICEYFNEEFPHHAGEIRVLIYRHSQSWPFYSGAVCYPVPSPLITEDAVGMYIITMDKWADSDYGNKRRDLCSHLANKFREI